MPRQRMEGFQKPLDSGRRKEVGLAVITLGENYAMCSCGKPFTQQRERVREDAIDRHLDRKHGGRGIRV